MTRRDFICGASGIYLRGALYFTIPVLGIVTERSATYAERPPQSEWEYVQLGCAAVGAGLIALRAYIDQHISNERKTGNGKVETETGTEDYGRRPS